MNAKKLFLSLLFTLAGGAICASGVSISHAASSPLIQLTVPSANFDLSDLDVRDKNNRPIKSAAAKKSLENLFTRSLNNLLLFNLTPTKRALQEFLSKTFQEYRVWFMNVIHSVFDFEAAWFKTKKESNILMIIMFLNGEWTARSHVHFLTDPRNNKQHLLTAILSSTVLRR